MFEYKNILFTIAVIINFTASFFTIWNVKKYMQDNMRIIRLIIISVVVLSASIVVLLKSINIIALQSYREWQDSIIVIYITFLLTLANINFFISSLTFLLAKKSGQKSMRIISRVALITSILGIFIPFFILITICLGVVVAAAFIMVPKASSSIEINKPSSVCPKCGFPISGNKHFCTKCGEKLNAI